MLVRHIPRHANDEVARRVPLGHIVHEVLSRKPVDRLLCAGNAPAQRLVPEHGVVGKFTGPCRGVVPGATDLLDDDLALSLHLLFSQQGVLDHVGDDVHRKGDLLEGDLGKVAGHLMRGEGVTAAAGALDGRRDHYRLGPLSRAFEEHMLEEVGDAVDPAVLITGTCSHEDINACGLRARHFGGDDAQTARQCRDMRVQDVKLLHCSVVRSLLDESRATPYETM